MEKKVKVSLSTDEHGMVGRECPKCEEYFKVKGGTGLSTTSCICPYCRYSADHQEFYTKDQVEYAKSVALKQVIEPELKKLERSFKGLERSTRGGLVQIKVTTKGHPIPLKHYQELELETHVKCDSCGLEFAIYGVFAGCPDCGSLNASVIFKMSIDVGNKRIQLLDTNGSIDKGLKEAILRDALSGGISAFDAFGKALRSEYPHLLPKRPRNLFQNLDALSEALSKSLGKSLSDIIGKDEAEFLFRMFQVRHAYEHTLGVVDEEFVKKVPDIEHLKGKKYPLVRSEIEKVLDILLSTGPKIQSILE